MSYSNKTLSQYRIAVIGLGYVGLPLANEFGKKYETIGFDINRKRIAELSEGNDRTLELSAEQLKSSPKLRFSSELDSIKGCDIYIITVPTPIDRYNRPDLTPLQKASESVGKVLSPGAIVIYESTVFPGCTEEECVPILEKHSGLVFNKDFYCGYSPERINPGDKEHTLTKILKVTSGSTPEAADIVDALYSSIITAGTHKASCMKVAEAAKVIENSQRDLNIAFVNELAKIFNRIGIDTLEVLEAAGTKWNFLPFRPGLVGGHCIGVDPYYLTHKAQEMGYHPEVILAGRRINDGMGAYVASEVIKLMIRKNHTINTSRVLVMGITFKENCPDIRNSRAIDVVTNMKEFGCEVDVYDPWADKEEVRHEYGIEVINDKDSITAMKCHYDAVILAVAHEQFKHIDFSRFSKNNIVIYDIKNCLPKQITDARL
ncbi:MAG: Vi polysaccharide biosynthesis UDP-N-acetylglucosamine C-6 dehydrogenase TviB [Victivallales bacterium]|nr:Vi polysaccharide biosynthesis UDP-N-acetylglucosamine C-6 dehydrogenase TviB [Victivallales bacterium]